MIEELLRFGANPNKKTVPMVKLQILTRTNVDSDCKPIVLCDPASYLHVL